MANTKTQNQNIIEENGEKYTIVKLDGDKELKIRHPKGRDLRFAMSGGGSDSDIIFKMASNLTCLSEAELDDMPARECSEILKEVSRFLG